MFYVFRLRYWLSPFQPIEPTGRLFSTFVNFWKGIALGRGWRRGVMMGLVAIALSLGLVVPTPAAQAADTPEAEAYDPGPIRQTRNPISGENFHGGVDDSALDKTESRRQPEDEDKGFFESLKDRVTGNEPTETPADLKTSKNPTLERYPQSLD